MAEAEAHLGRHATDASHRRARLVRAYRLLRRDLVGKDEADVRPRRTPMTMRLAGCAVARREDGSGFLITAYPTDAVKAGESVWTRSK